MRRLARELVRAREMGCTQPAPGACDAVPVRADSAHRHPQTSSKGRDRRRRRHDPDTAALCARAAAGAPLDDEQALALASCEDLEALLAAARARRDSAHPAVVSYSPKVFIPLTQLCRDVCRYCTFAHAPRALKAPYLSVDEAIAIAEAGARAGCHEALFTLGDQPERRYRVAREALAALGHATTIDYLARGRRAGARGDRAPAARQPRRDEPERSRAPARGLGLGRADAGIRRRSGCASAAGRTTAARTSAPRCGSRPSARPASCACRSPAAS